MIVLILGTPDSGKSLKAESLITEMSEGGEILYVATMIPYGKEGEERIARHRKMREGKGFITMECPTEVDRLIDDIDSLEEKNILLECMSNLVGNEMHSESNNDLSQEELSDRIITETMMLGEKSKNLVIVSNSFPEDDPLYDEDTRRYVKLVNKVNVFLKEKSDKTIELTDGEWIISGNL
ncbi:bifunctional adenosylcobinamide kinase/adenosylcobinamide-phosphate guanylyltransferase [Butyrivibrio sp. XPD2002]|uniref:bifunctional adenosylcobinamide kinase/adenosylcobinamide-phosphate guanylyltransferase n=1 Tax=Butyrivibrio sp. XPD2002 TaxID=1280665 RepID=UPI0003F8DF8E|nr:bifunctional adenosylcobinamide kinase/adenosylcobinamide-phosphate guanylyltransferase [Butyrivibrio sp. XPD2002]